MAINSQKRQARKAANMPGLVLFVGAMIVSEFGRKLIVIGAGVVIRRVTRFNTFVTSGGCPIKKPVYSLAVTLGRAKP